MILISHRGNISGRYPLEENKPNYIDLAISKGYDVEVDVWYIGEKIYLGHDNSQYEISLPWLSERISRMWLHCKNTESIVFFSELKLDFNFFWHEEDKLTLTSKGFIWAYPGNQPILNSISVLPEIYGDDVSLCSGICSDFIEEYNRLKKD